MITLFLTLSVPPLAVALLLDWMRATALRPAPIPTTQRSQAPSSTTG